MKLLSLNVEGITHRKGVEQHIVDQQPDVLCLQEAPESLVAFLEERGYHVTFAPIFIRTTGAETFPEGALLASRMTHAAEIHYYYRPQPTIVPRDAENERATKAQVVIVATVADATVATTHFTLGPKGNIASPEQITDLAALLDYLSTKPPHILCGDFNIPRGHNPLYDVLCRHYTDTIPRSYPSSLDGSLHRLGKDPSKAFLFTDYMVDYLFTQPPYTATDVGLTFGLSDHAAVHAIVTLSPHHDA